MDTTLVLVLCVTVGVLALCLLLFVSYYIWWCQKGQFQWAHQLSEFTAQHDGQVLLPTSHDKQQRRERVLFIVCPASGGGRAMELFPSCCQAFQQRGATVQVYVTKSSDDLLSLVRRTRILPSDKTAKNDNGSGKSLTLQHATNRNKQPLLPHSVDWKHDYDGIAVLAGDSSMTELMQDTLRDNHGIWPYAPLLPLPGGTANCLATEMFSPPSDPLKGGWNYWTAALCAGNINAKKLTGAQIVQQYDTIWHATILRVHNVVADSSTDETPPPIFDEQLEAQKSTERPSTTDDIGAVRADASQQDEPLNDNASDNTVQPLYALHVIAGGVMAHVSEKLEQRRQGILSNVVGHGMAVNWVICEAAITMPWRTYGLCIFNSDVDNDGIDFQYGNNSFLKMASVLHYPEVRFGFFGALPLMVKVATGWFGRRAEKPTHGSEMVAEHHPHSSPATDRRTSSRDNRQQVTVRLCQEVQLEQEQPYRLYSDGSMKLTLSSCSCTSNHERCQHRLQVQAIENAIPFWGLKPRHGLQHAARVRSKDDKLARTVSPVSVREINNLSAASQADSDYHQNDEGEEEERKGEEIPPLALSFDSTTEDTKATDRWLMSPTLCRILANKTTGVS